MKMIIAIENETHNENLINYYIIKNDKYSIYNYYKIDKKRLLIIQLMIILLLLFVKLLILI